MVLLLLYCYKQIIRTGDSKMNNDMKLYYDYTVSPLGKLFYKTIESQLDNIENKKILDFGSGFGFTAKFLAKKNDVTALEMNVDMIKASVNTANYTQIHGDLSALGELDDESFDAITCHLVLEFVDEPKVILTELMRVLKKGGILSVVKHNKNGRIIQAIVQDYDLEDAKNLLNGGYSFSSAFGNIKYYDNNILIDWTDNKTEIIDTFGARVLASIQNFDIQSKENWVEDMYKIETELLKDTDYIKIAYFNHILLKKI